MKKMIFGILILAANIANAELTGINATVNCQPAWGEPWYSVAIADNNSESRAFIIYNNRLMTLLATPLVSKSVEKEVTIYQDKNGQFELKITYNQYTGDLSATLFASAKLFSSKKEHKHKSDLLFRELECFKNVKVHYSHVLE